ncbi:hypothetical protein SAMN05216419_101815 [Nitrosomonas cryotolerans]|uniref:Uncharacterized protein n=1 Tax=Nitrosomonas cryotolerans ATCC 49181 TaxID=1131553 RepID=A0A1N6FV68_9PROT|nr:hypothetical protein [Nitrosomonas cryotolerans]SFP76438.1 hypothetical protein SAMN05216419_101815 [Nitrosomonas cryotolerans]SIN99110.1 hypothetical protein SAMN02743940_0415 [Nitrosomonas cryotolerans ATCC 49181]
MQAVIIFLIGTIGLSGYSLEVNSQNTLTVAPKSGLSGEHLQNPDLPCRSVERNSDKTKIDRTSRISAACHDGAVKTLPKETEGVVAKTADVGDIAYILVVGRDGEASVLRPNAAKSSRVYKAGDVIPNKGIMSVDSISVVTYQGSHCVGSTFRYVSGGNIYEICY